MSFWPKQGEAWAIKINAHREGWNGRICRDPCNWACDAKQEFREDYCNAGIDRCFHLFLFDEKTPYIDIEDKGGGWLFADHPDAFNDQLLLFYIHRASEPHGVSPGAPSVLAGYYVVDRVEEVPAGYRRLWRVHPKAGQFGALHELGVAAPRYRHLPQPYLRHVDPGALQTVARDLDEARHRVPSGSAMALSAQRFVQHVETWAARAWDNNKDRQPLVEVNPRNTQATIVYSSATPIEDGERRDGRFNTPFGGLPPRPQPLPSGPDDPPAASRTRFATIVTRSASSAPEPDEVFTPARIIDAGPPQRLPSPMIDDSHFRHLQTSRGTELAQALWLGSLQSNALVLLQGPPGTGKSHLATELVEPSRRSVVSVGSTWRGREELLGYVEPLNGRFLPTTFTRFLAQAEVAWRAGDDGPWLVVFEEFNLSPPEYWLSDILVRSQYPEDDESLRTIELGGSCPPDWHRPDCAVLLAPSVRFVATLNNDHTTRSLSPRVLDRASLVTVTLDVEDLFRRAGVAAAPDQLEAIKDLVDRLRACDVTISMRAALSIRHGLALGVSRGLGPWGVIDFVLATQVLSKVRLYAGDANALRMVGGLTDIWCERHGGRLPLCVSRAEMWRETLHAGKDVLQA